MRIGIFGGTFDPIHTGHLAIIQAVADSGCLDQIIVIPNAIPPHKSLSQISMATYRYEMVRIALAETSFTIPVSLSDIELFRKGKSYTLDTILELKSGYSPEDRFVLVYGSDVIYDIEDWHMPKQIMKECELFFAERPGFGGEKFQNKIKDLIDRYSARIAVFQADYIDISSTELRDMLLIDDKSADEYILPALHDWISKNRIYSDQPYFSRILPETIAILHEYERILQKMIGRNRLIHSLNTMREAVKLAFLYHGNIQKCAIAGLIHDCAKSMPENSGNVQFCNNIYGEQPNSFSDILHSYQGRQVAIDCFSIDDPDILNAIYFHTTARAESSLLEKIVFVADKIEPGRTFPGIEEIRIIAYTNLEEGMLSCLYDIIELLKRCGKTPHPDSLAAYQELYKNTHNKQTDK
jgi:nicotinate-nucleotide adenylyltransferase